MMFAPPDGFNGFGITPEELAKLGFRIAASPGAAFAAMYKAVKQSYQALYANEVNPYMGRGGVRANMLEAHQTCDLEKLVEIERRTMQD
jgi:2-methylisocitrate lyase-like PEP mutase family enzyme